MATTQDNAPILLGDVVWVVYNDSGWKIAGMVVEAFSDTSITYRLPDPLGNTSTSDLTSVFMSKQLAEAEAANRS